MQSYTAHAALENLIVRFKAQPPHIMCLEAIMQQLMQSQIGASITTHLWIREFPNYIHSCIYWLMWIQVVQDAFFLSMEHRVATLVHLLAVYVSGGALCI